MKSLEALASAIGSDHEAIAAHGGLDVARVLSLLADGDETPE